MNTISESILGIPHEEFVDGVIERGLTRYDAERWLRGRRIGNIDVGELLMEFDEDCFLDEML